MKKLRIPIKSEDLSHIAAYICPYPKENYPVERTKKYLLPTEFWNFKDLSPWGKFGFLERVRAGFRAQIFGMAFTRTLSSCLVIKQNFSTAGLILGFFFDRARPVEKVEDSDQVGGSLPYTSIWPGVFYCVSRATNDKVAENSESTGVILLN